MIEKSGLTRQDAIDFVRDKLGIDDVESAGNTFESLSKIQRHLLSEVPFQNISLISTPPEKRFPTVEDVISDGLSLRGGTCVHNNWFAYLLLKALGYDAFPISAVYCAEKEYDDLHMMTVVGGLVDPEDPECKEPLFLFDTASGFPIPAPVPLHRLPITYPETAGLELRFARYGDYVYRMHHDNDPLPEECHPDMDGWKVVMKFKLSPRDPPSLRKGMEVSFCADPPGPFMRSTRMFRWPKGQEWAVAIRGYELLFYGKKCPEPLCHYDEKKRKHAMIVEDSDLGKTITKYFPTICQKQLKVTISRIDEYRRMQEESSESQENPQKV